MAVTDYFTINGKLHGQSIAGINPNSFILSYGTDALGSVVTTYNGGAVQNAYRYKPYGGLLAKTGTGLDPAFQWVGGQGYRSCARQAIDYYVRARHYSVPAGRWATPDPLGLTMPQYSYANCSPPTESDPSGEIVATPAYAHVWQLWSGGYSRSFINWADVPNEDGYIVQRIHTRSSIKPVFGQEILLRSCEFYESWCVFKGPKPNGPIIKGSIGCGFVVNFPHDSWGNPNSLGTDFPYRFTYKNQGDYKFYRKAEIPNYSSIFKDHSKDLCMSQAFSLLTAPIANFNMTGADNYQRIVVESDHNAPFLCSSQATRRPSATWLYIDNCGSAV